VAFVDDLEERGLVERRRNPTDRRQHALYLTPAGEELMRELAVVGRQHEQQITAGLTAEQRATLMELLSAVVARQGLTPGVHPGYRSLGRATESDAKASRG
jgi:DNA-binding MarR family transcriptional regulator